MYDGPEPSPSAWPSATTTASVDAPVTSDRVWPVRQPGATDGQRMLLMALGMLSIVLLGCAVVLSVAALLGRPVGSSFVLVTLAGGTVSLTAHLLMLLRLWVRR
jgi:hypothetical protein